MALASEAAIRAFEVGENMEELNFFLAGLGFLFLVSSHIKWWQRADYCWFWSCLGFFSISVYSFFISLYYLFFFSVTVSASQIYFQMGSSRLKYVIEILHGGLFLSQIQS